MPALSNAEREFIDGGVACGIRSDGRELLTIRPVTLETCLLRNAAGSARIRVGGVTDVLVGVKAEIGRPHLQKPDEGVLEFTVECSSLASPDFVGRGAADLNAELAQGVARLYRNDATRELRKALCLVPGVKCWTLHIDALVLDSGGGLQDALSVAVRAALRTSRLPNVIVIPGEADEEPEIDVDENTLTFLKHANQAPVAVTLSCIGKTGTYIADSSSEEEMCASAALTVGINQEGKACGTVCGGTGGVDKNTLAAMFQDASRIGVDVIKNNDKFLDQEIKLRLGDDPVEPVGFFA